MRTAVNRILIQSSLAAIVRCTDSHPITGLDKPWWLPHFKGISTWSC